MKHLVLAYFIGLAYCQADTIGASALVDVPERAKWNFTINFQPGDGEEAITNPPRFSWFYTKDPQDIYSDTEAKTFQFIIDNDADFSSPVVDVETNSNMYNFLDILSTGVTYYWKIGYIHYGESTPYEWSATRTFTIASDAVEWDRSMLADETYLAGKTHPRLLFTAANRAALKTWLDEQEAAYDGGANEIWESDTGEGWKDLKSDVADTLAADWWPGTDPTPDLSQASWGHAFVRVAFYYQLTQDSDIADTEPELCLMELVDYYINNEFPIKDSITVDTRWIEHALAFGYDWLYDLMTPEQRTKVLDAMDLRARFLTQSMGYFHQAQPPFDYGHGDMTGEYPGEPTSERGSSFKCGGPHPFSNTARSFPVALAGYSESEACRKYLDLMLNNMIGKIHYCMGDGPTNNGRGYAGYELFIIDGLPMHGITQSVFPECTFNKNPQWEQHADWMSRWIPPDFTEGHEPFGDTGWGRKEVWETNDMGRLLGDFLDSDKFHQHWRNQLDLSTRYRAPDLFYQLALAWRFQGSRGFEDETDLIKPYLADGWVIGSSLPPNDADAFNDGVGFVFQARTQGSKGRHDHYSDLCYQLWAYGTTLTDGGSGMTNYAKIPYSNNGLLIDGRGTVQRLRYPERENAAKILAYEEGADYSYTLADALGAYPTTEILIGGWLMPATFANKHSNAELAHLTKVRRHFLFMRNKYFIIYDELEASQPSKFTWLYHVLEADLTLDSTNKAFTYNANIEKHLETGTPPDVKVIVKHVGELPNIALTDQTGLNVRANLITGEDYYADGGNYYRNHALWCSTVVNTTKHHFMTVIFPVKPGDNDPTITSLDSQTVQVVNGAETDIISFDAASAFSPTLRVDLTGDLPSTPSGNGRAFADRVIIGN